MRHIIILCIISLLGAVGCKDRPQMLREKMIGRWIQVNPIKQLFFKIGLTITDSIVFMTDQPGYFYANRYEISPLDSITFYTHPHDTLTCKLSFSNDDDTLKLRTNDMDGLYLEMVKEDR